MKGNVFCCKKLLFLKKVALYLFEIRVCKFSNNTLYLVSQFIEKKDIMNINTLYGAVRVEAKEANNLFFAAICKLILIDFL